jgi:hypothetical protein
VSFTSGRVYLDRCLFPAGDDGGAALAPARRVLMPGRQDGRREDGGHERRA